MTLLLLISLLRTVYHDEEFLTPESHVLFLKLHKVGFSLLLISLLEIVFAKDCVS